MIMMIIIVKIISLLHIQRNTGIDNSIVGNSWCHALVVMMSRRRCGCCCHMHNMNHKHELYCIMYGYFINLITLNDAHKLLNAQIK